MIQSSQPWISHILFKVVILFIYVLINACCIAIDGNKSGSQQIVSICFHIKSTLWYGRFPERKKTLVGKCGLRSVVVLSLEWTPKKIKANPNWGISNATSNTRIV